MRLLAMFVGLCCVAAPAIAGWHSGGGNLPSDELNPWWVSNTTQVDYCIEIDTAHFGLELQAARTRIQGAFAYWQRQFRAVDDGPDSDLSIKLATQTFTEVPCYVGIALKFQLGTLTAQQALYLRQPQHIVAQSVRTDYDPVLMRAKGFVYVAPEFGDLALAGSLGIGPMAPDHWRAQNGMALEFVLVHELGHIFGLQHRPNSIMEANWPAWSVSQNFIDLFTEETVVPDVFLPVVGKQVSLMSGRYTLTSADDYQPLWTQLLGVPKMVERLELRPLGLASAGLYASDKGQTDFHLLGTFKTAADGGAREGAISDPLIYIYMAPGQKAFPNIKNPDSGLSQQIYLPITIFHPVIYTEIATGVARPMSMDFYNGSIMLLNGVTDKTIASAFLSMTRFYLKSAKVK